MIQNLDARLSKLQTQCDSLRNKLSTFPEGELSIQKNGTYHRPSVGILSLLRIAAKSFFEGQASGESDPYYAGGA